MIRFTIPYPSTREGMTAWSKRYSLNAYWSGKHYKARSLDADAMKGYILPDDNRKWVKHVSCEFWEKKAIMVEVMPYGEGTAL